MGARIIIADGVDAWRSALQSRLTAACYDVQAASSWHELAFLIEVKRPDLLILSGDLTDVCKIATCERVLQIHGMSKVPLLFVAPQHAKAEGMRAGATIVDDDLNNQQLLLARVRNLLRDAEPRQALTAGLAEDPGAFQHAPIQCVALVADDPARADNWKSALSKMLPYRFVIECRKEALNAVNDGQAADLYLIAATINADKDGLELMSDLRSREGSRDAAFVIATGDAQNDVKAAALDLGAGDVLPLNFENHGGMEGAALSIKKLMDRKKDADALRAENLRKMLLANFDPLTGLYNRRFAEPRLAEIARDSVAKDRGFAVLVMDLDYFKRVNDLHGHPAGDAILAEAARRLEKTVGASGLVWRHGGEEFLAVLPDTNEAKARELAESIRSSVEDYPFSFTRSGGLATVSVTISVGLAHSSTADTRLRPKAIANQMIEQADQALFKAKAYGRNQVVSLSSSACI